ncbi:MAG: glycine cleavage system protein GcvH [bacterium]
MIDMPVKLPEEQQCRILTFPEDLLYADTHEWVRDEGGKVTIGITDYAQSQLKDIVYVDLPEVGSEFKRGDSIGVVESVKTVADVYTPVTGKVTEANFALKDRPEFINEDPYGKGWLIKMEIQDRGELKGLQSSKAYQGSLATDE